MVGRGAVGLLLEHTGGTLGGRRALLGRAGAALVPPPAGGLRGPLVPAVGGAGLRG